MGSLPFGDYMVFHGGASEDRRGFSTGGGCGSQVGRLVGASSSSMMFDAERGELVRATATAKKGAEVSPEMKATIALKSHCKAERRRRERINSHLTTLRGLVQSSTKLDKAALLAEVIAQVKELKNKSVELSRQFTLPSDTNGVTVEVNGDELKASICCEDRPELVADLRRTVRSLRLKITGGEISFLGGRVKNVFVFDCGTTTTMDRNHLKSSVQQALESILERISAQAEFSAGTLFAGKRRMSPFESTYSFS